MIERLRVSVWLARQVQLSASGCLCERKLVCGRVQKTCCEGNWNLCIHTGVISIQIWPLKPSACAHEAAPKHSSLLDHLPKVQQTNTQTNPSHTYPQLDTMNQREAYQASELGMNWTVQFLHFQETQGGTLYRKHHFLHSQLFAKAAPEIASAR